jgi:AhpD family alkylhydroperoxidase
MKPIFKQEDLMEPRIDYYKLSPEGYRAMLGLEHYLSHSSVEKKLLHLLKLRVSQINGCAYCLDMHWKDLLVEGEDEQRMYSLDAWREAPYYTERERAALAWAEAVTNITNGHVPDAVYEDARQHFSEQELADLTLAVVAINGWNRISIAFRVVPGTYQPQQLKKGA